MKPLILNPVFVSLLKQQCFFSLMLLCDPVEAERLWGSPFSIVMTLYGVCLGYSPGFCGEELTDRDKDRTELTSRWNGLKRTALCNSGSHDVDLTCNKGP